jgi:predicted aspartyl protease
MLDCRAGSTARKAFMGRACLGRCLRLAVVLAALPHLAVAAASCTAIGRAAIALQIERRSAFVPMTINGGPATFLLDTGAERTIVSDAAARRLGLAAHYTDNRSMMGFGGAVATGEVHPDSVKIGTLAMSGFFALVGAVTLPKLAGQPADGLLGGDVLADFDLDLAFGEGRLGLYAPTDCEDPVLPWRRPPHGTAAHASMRRHLVFDVQIAGRTLPAFIDTGAQVSFIDADAAARLGVGADALRQDPSITVHGVGSSASGLRRHRFERLEVAGVAWTEPVLVVAPLKLDDADVILGADFLESHRVWFAYHGHRLFVSTSG